MIFKLQSSSAAVFNQFKYKFLDPSDSDLFPKQTLPILRCISKKNGDSNALCMNLSVTLQLFPSYLSSGSKTIKISLMKLYYPFLSSLLAILLICLTTTLKKKSKTNVYTHFKDHNYLT